MQSTVAFQHDNSLPENDPRAVAGMTSRQKKRNPFI